MKDLSKTEIKLIEDIKLSAPSKAQIKSLIKLFQNPENIDFVGEYTDWPYNPNLEEKIKEWIQQSEQGKFIFFIILVKNKIAGTCRILDINYEDKKATLGYILLKQYTRQGIATSCIKALLELCFYELKLNKVLLEIDARNRPSIKLEKKLRFFHEGTLRQDYTYHYKPSHELSDWQIWSMLKSEYKS